LAFGDVNFDGFHPITYLEIEKDSLSEDVAAWIQPLGNGTVSLKVVSGGNVVSPSKNQLRNREYTISSEGVKTTYLGEEALNTKVLKEADGNLFLGNHSHPFDFGNLPESEIIDASGVHQSLGEIGMVTDAVWDDFSGDGKKDLIVVGEWMAPKFFENTPEGFKERKHIKDPLRGLWQAIQPFDVDGDGDTDYLLGNWGLNSKFMASEQHPMRMYYADFDNNGFTETVIAIYKEGKYVPLLGLDDLSSQMVFLRKKFTNYKDFAGKSVEEIFGDYLKKATILEVDILGSGYLKNEQGIYRFEPFALPLQVSPVLAFETFDFNADGKNEVLMGGNYFGVIPFHGRYDSFPGALLYSATEFELGSALGLDITQKSVRHLKVFEHNKKPYLLIVFNNDKADVYEIVE